MTFLVLGATGQQGGAVARALLRRGQTVRALTRKTDSSAARTLAGLGATVVAGDLDRPETLPPAFAGVRGVFSVQDFYSPGVGLAYISFARTEPGVFRLAFGLTEGHENDPDLQAKGERTFDVVVRCAAACLGLPPDDRQVQTCAYMLWCFAHGHSFLTIDNKRSTVDTRIDDWTYLLTAARAILGQPVRG